MQVSVLVSTYNGEKDVRSLLDSILGLAPGDYEVEVILRDDTSSDGTADIVEQEYGWVKLIRGKGGNVGFVQSNNIALQRAAGEIICCVNQDTILHPRFLAEGVAALQRDQQVLGINTNMIMPWIMTVDEFEQKTLQTLPAYEYQLTPFGFVRYVEVDKRAHKASFMTGGAFFIRRSTIHPGGNLFDPAIDMYCEDTELSLRVRKNGDCILYCPLAVVYHNQAARRGGGLHELLKLLKITRNRFALFARINSPFDFTLRYPLYLAGILLKMSYLGLSFPKNILAYTAGSGVALLFFCLFPYWLIYSFKGEHPAAQIVTPG
jgi:GT2 family glycosyltransferase